MAENATRGGGFRRTFTLSNSACPAGGFLFAHGGFSLLRVEHVGNVEIQTSDSRSKTIRTKRVHPPIHPPTPETYQPNCYVPTSVFLLGKMRRLEASGRFDTTILSTSRAPFSSKSILGNSVYCHVLSIFSPSVCGLHRAQARR